MRLAAFNIENMFERAIALNLEDWHQGSAILEDFKQLNELIQHDVYTEEIKTNLLTIMSRYGGLLTNGENKFLRLREVRGKLIARPRNKPPEISPAGSYCQIWCTASGDPPV